MLKGNVFDKYFGGFFKSIDPNKVEGKGTYERFIDVAAEDMDELRELSVQMLPNIYEPNQAKERFLSFLESMLGFKTDNLYFSKSQVRRRAILSVIHRLYAIRSTKKGYEITLKMLGFTSVEIIEHEAGYSFDSEVTFDDEVRHFDSSCPPCSEYSINLEGSFTWNNFLAQAVSSIMKFHQPIDTKIRQIAYNGNALTIVPADFNTDFSEDFNIYEWS
jgi:phage tail-like protein